MALEWSLKEIYESYTSKEFLDDLKKVDNGIGDLKAFSNAVYEGKDNIKNLENFINKLESINLVVTKIFNYANLTLSTDSQNIEGRKYLDIIINIVI